MNLRQAIEAGARRVNRRGRREYIRVMDDDTVEACALGAAYLGCHPEADPRTLDRDRDLINQWLISIPHSNPSPIGGPRWVSPIIGINDLVLDESDGFDELIAKLADDSQTATALNEEICNPEVAA